MKRLNRLLPIMLAAFTLAGCVSAPIPEGYSGPIAVVRDTVHRESSNRGQLFLLNKIDGNTVSSALDATRKASQGMGFLLVAVDYSREIPARQATFTLLGTTVYAAPIQAMINASTLYEVEHTLVFTPESNKTYVVRGVLTADKKEVWLEEEGTGRIIESTAPASSSQ